MDHLGGCPLANNDRGDISVLGLGIAPHAGLGGIANGNIGFGGCPCSDGAMGFAGTPRASLGGQLMFALASAVHLVPALTAIRPVATSALAAVLCLAMMEEVGAAWWPAVVNAAWWLAAV